MSIDPRLLSAPGDVPQIYTSVSDLDRRVRMLEAARGVIGAGTITGGTGGMIGTGVVTGGNIAGGTITATQIQAGSITATLIAVDAINAGHIQAGAVTASEIAANTITASQIASNTITSNEIAANTITASDIAASTITSNEIATGTIVASDIAAGTITAEQIAIGARFGDNLIGNPSAEGASTAAWGGAVIEGTASSFTSVLDTANAPDGDYYFQIGASGGSGAAYGYKAISVVPGRTYSLRLWLHHSNGNGTYYVRMSEKQTYPTGDYVTSALRNSFTSLANNLPNSNITSWTEYSFTYTVPAGINWVSLSLYNWGPSTGNLHFDAVEFRPQVSGTVIANDSITSSHIAATTIQAADIAAGTITATQIASGTITGTLIASATITGGNLVAGTITATQIGVSSLSAISANMGTITAGTITGATFQSSASNPRVWLDSTGLKATNAAGEVTLFADASIGRITALAGVGGSNMLRRSDGESTDWATYWAGGSGRTLAQSTTQWKYGTKSISVTPTSGAAPAYFFVDSVRPAKGSTVYTISAWVYATSATPRTLTFMISSTQTGGGANANQFPNGVPFTPVQNQWTRIIATWTTLSDVKDITAYLHFNASADVSTFYVDGVQLEEGYVATSWGRNPEEIYPAEVSGGGGGGTGQIQSGTIIGTDLLANTITATQIAASTITSTQIAALTITAGNIQAGAITAAKIGTGEVTADKISVAALSAISADVGSVTAGNISGVTITGATVQTNAIGARVVLDAGGMTAYNASNVPQVIIPTAGAASFAGSLDAVGGLTQDAVTSSPAAAARKHTWLDSNDSEIASIFGATSAYPGTATPRVFASATAPMSYNTLVKSHANLVHYWRAETTATLTDEVAGGLTLNAGGTAASAAGLISGSGNAIKTAPVASNWYLGTSALPKT